MDSTVIPTRGVTGRREVGGRTARTHTTGRRNRPFLLVSQKSAIPASGLPNLKTHLYPTNSIVTDCGSLIRAEAPSISTETRLPSAS